MAAVSISAKERKRILTVLFTSLLLDLISFTFILPLFPKLLEFYRNLESPSETNSTLNRILAYLNTYKNSFARPISDRYDIVLLGGALGSLFSFLQAIASPIIGRLSDRHGRRTALLWSMVGNILSVALWVAAVDFRTFLASRIVGGLSEGNVQLAMAIATDVSDENSRGSTMAMVGVCFSVAFTLGPALGAALSNVTTVSSNPFATAAGFSLFLLIAETLFLYLYLPETLPKPSQSSQNGNPSTRPKTTRPASVPRLRTNNLLMLNFTHFVFLLIFSGIEFSLPFMTYDLFEYGSTQSGRLLGFIGFTASLLQGSFTRRSPPLRVVRTGVVSCAAGFFLLSRVQTQGMLYVAAAMLAVTSATVVTGLTSLASFEAGVEERGGKLGSHRSWGQAGRATGPLLFCTLYWWAGRSVAYSLGGLGMLGVCALVFGGLKSPPGAERKAPKVAKKL